MPPVQPRHNPVRSSGAGTGILKGWMAADDPIQDRLLVRLYIDEEHMLAFL
jgi:hypothetical protein